MEQKLLRKRIFFYFIVFSASAFFPLFISSKCSVLYPFNDWPDINTFFTMGKGMLHGKILYADMVDQKGPYVFALFALSYALSHTTFHGVFVLEWLFMCFSLYQIYRIISLYTAHADRYLWIYPIFCSAIAGSKSFVHGGSVEEFFICIYLYGIYTLLSLLRSTSKEMTFRIFGINGILTAILFWSKYTVLGFYIGWLLIVMLIYFSRKKWKQLIQGLLSYAFGFFCATLPWICYFGIHHKIKVWLEVYIWDNIFRYSTTGNLNIFQKLGTALLLGIRSIKDAENLCYGIWIILGGLVFIFLPFKKVSLYEKAAFLMLGLFSILGIFIGGAVQDYYCLPLSAFFIVGVLSIVVLGDSLLSFKQRKQHAFPILATILLLLSLVGSTYLDYRISSNTYLLSYSKMDMPQYQFAAIIKESDDESVLNYGFLDGGFYTVLDQVPNMRYFCTLNVDYFSILEEQNKYLDKEMTNWVVTWRGEITTEEELRQIPVLTEHNELVTYVYFPLELDYRTYALYRRK